MAIKVHQKQKIKKSYLKNIVWEAIEFASLKQSLEIPKTPNLPKNIASVPEPDKQDIINNQTSRFNFILLLTHFSFPIKDEKYL